MHDPLCLVFYTGKGTLMDRVIRLITRSPYSHVELVLGDLSNDSPRTLLSILANARDGGVRQKSIVFQAERWELLPIEGWSGDQVWIRVEAELGRPYDYLGILLNFTVQIRRHLRGSWFCSELCSELCGDALGLEQPHRLSPGALYDVVKARNAAHLPADYI